MGFNERLAARFEQMAQLLELTGANRFKVNAYSKAARTVSDYAGDLESIAHDKARLTELDGIGDSTADKIAEFAETGKIEEHAELMAEVPSGLLPLLDVNGLGPKTIAAAWKELGITDAAAFRRALEDGSILELKGMGEKQAAKLRAAMEQADAAGRRLPLGQARPIAERLVEHMRGVRGVARAEIAGSLRRGKETIGDLDILVVAEDAAGAHAAFRNAPGVTSVIASGETKTSVRIALEVDYGRWASVAGDGDPPTVQADLRTVPERSWGAALLYFTGSKEHNVKLRERALARGLTLNEYGLFPHEKGADGSPQSRGVEPVASESEESVYATLGLPWIAPELREDRGELSTAEKGRAKLPGLIEVSQIRSELHAHTTASDGMLELDELITLAQERGFHTIAVTDHSTSSVQAGGLSVERLREQRARIEEARERFGDSITILAGSEVDIMVDGRLDYDDEVLAELDMVVASPHQPPSQDPAKATRRLLRAIEHPLVRVLGHPTGRLIGRRKGLEPDMGEIFAAAKEHDVALEINSHWMRLDLRDTHVRGAIEAGCLLAIHCDVHQAQDFENIVFGVSTARRGWLEPERCINTWDRGRLLKWIQSSL